MCFRGIAGKGFPPLDQTDSLPNRRGCMQRSLRLIRYGFGESPSPATSHKPPVGGPSQVRLKDRDLGKLTLSFSAARGGTGFPGICTRIEPNEEYPNEMVSVRRWC